MHTVHCEWIGAMVSPFTKINIIHGRKYCYNWNIEHEKHVWVRLMIFWRFTQTRQRVDNKKRIYRSIIIIQSTLRMNPFWSCTSIRKWSLVLFTKIRENKAKEKASKMKEKKEKYNYCYFMSEEVSELFSYGLLLLFGNTLLTASRTIDQSTLIKAHEKSLTSGREKEVSVDLETITGRSLANFWCKNRSERYCSVNRTSSVDCHRLVFDGVWYRSHPAFHKSRPAFPSHIDTCLEQHVDSVVRQKVSYRTNPWSMKKWSVETSFTLAFIGRYFELYPPMKWFILSKVIIGRYAWVRRTYTVRLSHDF